MKSTLAISAVIFTIGFVSIPLFWSNMVWSDSDDRWHESDEYEYRSNGTTAINNPAYTEECGSCHMAYPAGLLSTDSWTKVMANLEDHFGDNSELDAQTHQLISEFLLTHSANRSNDRLSRKFTRSSKTNDAPLRITATPYFIHEHDEIPQRIVTGNTEVNSFSHCNACHSKAEQGSFNEHDVHIPGYGQWDD